MTVEEILKAYDEGERLQDILNDADYYTLRRLQTLLSRVLGAENPSLDKASTIADILKKFDDLTSPANASMGSAVTAFFNESTGEDERGNATSPTINTPGIDSWENTVISGVLPKARNHYLTTYGIMRQQGVPGTKENATAIKNFILDMLAEHVMPLEINGRVRPRYEWFCFGRKKGSRQTLYIDPEAGGFIVDSLNLPIALPTDKSHWLPVTGVLRKCRMSQGKDNIAHMGQVLVEMRDADTSFKTASKACERSGDHIGVFVNTGPTAHDAGKIYVSPDFVEAHKEVLVDRCTRLRNEAFYMLAPYDACKAIGVNIRAEDIAAMKKVLEHLHAQSERTVHLAADGHVAAVPNVPMQQVIRSIRDSGRDMLQIDRRAIPVLKEEIQQKFERIRFPRKDWLAPRAVAPLLGHRLVTTVNAREVLLQIFHDRKDHPITTPEGDMLVGDAFYHYKGPKGPSMTIMPTAIEALKPFVPAAVTEVRKQGSMRKA